MPPSLVSALIRSKNPRRLLFLAFNNNDNNIEFVCNINAFPINSLSFSQNEIETKILVCAWIKVVKEYQSSRNFLEERKVMIKNLLLRFIIYKNLNVNRENFSTIF
jgi:hypothetical protein